MFFQHVVMIFCWRKIALLGRGFETQFTKMCLAYHGFFTKTALARDKKYARWWMGNSEAFSQLPRKYREDIQNNLHQIDGGSNIDIMTFEQFLEAILIHLENTKNAKYRRRWTEKGEDHISLS